MLRESPFFSPVGEKMSEGQMRGPDARSTLNPPARLRPNHHDSPRPFPLKSAEGVSALFLTLTLSPSRGEGAIVEVAE